MPGIQAPAPIATVSIWRKRATIAVAAASIVVVASATFLGLWAARARGNESAAPIAAAPARVQTLTTTGAPLPPRAHADEPFVPIVDVKSLPPVRRRAAPPPRPAPVNSAGAEVLAPVDPPVSVEPPAPPAPIAASDETP
jgi:hypothetical protein